MKNLFFTLTFTIIAINCFSQKQNLPEGWDLIIFEGEPAYMNLVTGDVVTEFPKKAATKKEEVAEYDPTIIHKIEKGETLSKIARKYNIPLAQLYKLNNLENFDAIKIGQQIVVGYSKEVKEVPNEKYEDTFNTYHTVKSGETLYRISKNYNISVNKLKTLNDLTSNSISVGQRLIVK